MTQAIVKTERALEKHYSVQELAQRWSLSQRTIRRLFADEPGVLRYGHGYKKRLQAYVTLRIPESVVVRVHAKLGASPRGSV